MKLKKGILQRRTGESTALVIDGKGSGFSGVIHSNPTASFIIKCLRHNTTEERILKKMKRRFDGDPDEMLADLRLVIEELRRSGVIDE